jgi:hypothetical protein
MADKRRIPRASAKYQGKVVLAGRPDIDCSIRDLSAFGARLQFRVRAFLPRNFKLRFNGMEKDVRVVWQSGLLAGVRFPEPMTAQVPKARKRSLWSALRGA